MRIEEDQPDISLRRFIKRYLQIEASKQEVPEARVLPTGFSYLVYVYAQPCLTFIENKLTELPDLFVVGQVTTKDVKLFPRDKLGNIAVEFHPCSLHLFFGLDMSKTINQFNAFEPLCQDKEAVMSLADIFKKPIAFAQKCKLLDDFFKDMISLIHELPQVSKAVDIVIENNGMISVTAVADKVGLSERQLRRQFQKMCGISPQKYAKIIQVKSVFRQIRNGEHSRLQDLAYDCAFFDVSHFIKSFKKLIGDNPRSFLESEDTFIQRYIRNS